MDSKVNKYYLSRAFLGLLGYFIGSAIFTLMGGSRGFYRLLASFAFSGILFLLSELISAKRNPVLKHEVEIEEKDERGKNIQGKAGVFTFTCMLVVYFIIMFVGAFFENTLISMGAAGLVLTQLIIFLVSTFYWRSKL